MNNNLSKKIIRKLKQLPFRMLLLLRIDLSGNKKISELKFNWKTYRYLEKKYAKFLKKLPKYKGTNESSNIVWWCWLQGEKNAPEINKACLNSLRKNLKDRKIIVITNENLKEYIDFPNFINEKYQKGVISNTHYSDLIRLQLLIKYGGTWIDSSVLCTNYEKLFFDRPLFVFNNFMKNDDSIVASSWFITAEKDNPILKTTRDLLFEYWKKHNTLIHYFIFHLFFTMATKKYSEDWKNVSKFSNVPPHILQFEMLDNYNPERFKEICQISSFHKLTQKLDLNKKAGYTNYDYIIDNYKGPKK